MHIGTLSISAVVFMPTTIVMFLIGIFSTFVTKRSKKLFHGGCSDKIVIKTANPLLLLIISIIFALLANITVMAEFAVPKLEGMHWLLFVLSLVVIIVLAVIMYMVFWLAMLVVYFLGVCVRYFFIKRHYKKRFGLDVDITIKP